eukprot:TRINITY_DN7801_c0_g1_i1.p6 TRINITY_DN7801_c0_g1~~TRINITY_DN7801_c0_g1_i1.p6  ORF type:complete len:109 (+),score=16.17 TRINITY_DN7801_c0_g1_i1:726-1052(+)
MDVILFYILIAFFQEIFIVQKLIKNKQKQAQIHKNKQKQAYLNNNNLNQMNKEPGGNGGKGGNGGQEKSFKEQTEFNINNNKFIIQLYYKKQWGKWRIWRRFKYSTEK